MKGHPKAFFDQHEARVQKHLERLQTMTALLATHEQLPRDDWDVQYLRDLKYRIGKLRTQLRNMGETYIFINQ